MAAFSSIIGAIGLGVAAAGGVMQYQGMKKQAEYQQQAIAAQERAEQLRKQQMDLDAARRKREIIRQTMAARAASLAITTAQGASSQGGSALPGAYASVGGRGNVNWLGVDQNQQIGQQQFDNNRGLLNIYRQSAQAGTMASFGAGLGSLGGALMRNADTIGRIGTYFSGGFGSGGPNSLGGSLASRA